MRFFKTLAASGAIIFSLFLLTSNQANAQSKHFKIKHDSKKGLVVLVMSYEEGLVRRSGSGIGPAYVYMPYLDAENTLIPKKQKLLIIGNTRKLVDWEYKGKTQSLRFSINKKMKPGRYAAVVNLNAIDESENQCHMSGGEIIDIEAGKINLVRVRDMPMFSEENLKILEASDRRRGVDLSNEELLAAFLDVSEWGEEDHDRIVIAPTEIKVIKPVNMRKVVFAACSKPLLP